MRVHHQGTLIALVVADHLGKGDPLLHESVTWSLDARRLRSGSWDETVKLWDAEAGEPILTLTGHKDIVIYVAWSPNAQQIASGSDDQTVRVWDAETKKQQYVLEGHTARVLAVPFADNGRILCLISTGGRLIIWRTNGWVEVANVERLGHTTQCLSHLAVLPRCH